MSDEILIDRLESQVERGINNALDALEETIEKLRNSSDKRSLSAVAVAQKELSGAMANASIYLQGALSAVDDVHKAKMHFLSEAKNAELPESAAGQARPGPSPGE